MRRWLGVALGGCALMALWALPPRDALTFAEAVLGARFGTRYESPELAAYRKVRAEAGRAAEVFQRLRWRDSLAVLAAEAGKEARGYRVALPEYAPPEAGPELENAVAAQLREAGVDRPRVPVGVVFLESMTLAHPWQIEESQGAWSGEEILVSTDPGSPFCFLVEHYRRFPDDTTHLLLDRAWQRRVTALPGNPAPSPLGPCVYHARYGNPGPEILRWLAREGYTFASDLQPRWGLPAPPQDGDLRSSPLGRGLFGARRGLFGARQGMYSSFFLRPDAEGCLMGDPGICADLVTRSGAEGRPRFLGELDGGARPGHDPLTLGTSLYFDSHFLGGDANLFPDLEREFGPERFQRFWSSDLPVEEAFREGFGEPMGEWVMRWAQARLGALHPSPPVRAGASALTLGLVLLLAGVAVVARRRPA